MKKILAGLVLLLLAVGAPTVTASAITAPTSGHVVTSPVTISGVDLHDTTIRKVGATYYMYGSMYGCGFEWNIAGTPWCGFGVSTSSSLSGPWTAPVELFDPQSQDPFAGVGWQETCGGTGQGCFNPRMIQRSGWGANDGVWILWFNSPRHWNDTGGSAYNVMGCAGPAGPCGPGVVPYGSYNKPSLSICAGNGDFGIIERPGTRPAIVCTMPGAAQLNLQELNWWGSGGTGNGVVKVAGMGKVEGPGGYWDEAHQVYVLTFSDPGCGYCPGTGAGYATAPSLYSGWTFPANSGWGAPVNGRRLFSPSSCGGQPRTVTVIDGQPWQIIDLWLGTRNETAAKTHLVPLDYAPMNQTVGEVYRPALNLYC